MNNMNKNS